MKWPYRIAGILEAGPGITLLLFGAIISALLFGVFLPNLTLFSNDGPLGQLSAQCHHLPDRFTGCWADLNNVGFDAGSAAPNISLGLQWLLGPLWFSKFYAIIGLLILGFSAWCFFRQLNLSPLACTLGGIATMLNSGFFSTACWGMAAHVITVGMFFLALAAVLDTQRRPHWLRLVLAGLAVGMAVAEGADVGAILSLYVAAFLIYQAWTDEGSKITNLAKGIGRLLLVAVCAFFLAAQPVYSLVTTYIEGVAGAQQDIQTRDQHWDWATQWSLPKRELPCLFIPGLYGYRMDSSNGAGYWGIMGRDPAWEKYYSNDSQGAEPTGFLRFSGGGNYEGVLVLLVAIWAAVQSFFRKNSTFDLRQRKWLWFWLGIGVFSLLLALGRFAPFYRLIYALPYFSTIRNPVKFLIPSDIAIVTLFAYGIDGLNRRYLAPDQKIRSSHQAGLLFWWSRATQFEKYWVYGCGVIFVAALVGWQVYSSCHADLVEYLQRVHINGNWDAIVNFSVRQVEWFVLFFFLAASLMILIFSGAFTDKISGGVFLALLLITDLLHANQPWVVYWNYPDKYASNAVIDRLREQPYEHRVTLAPVNPPPQLMAIEPLYRVDWMQHQFPFYNIQSFDLVQMSRMPADFSSFVDMLDQSNVVESMQNLSRAWQLTNTRYIIGPRDLARFWNNQSDLPPLAFNTVMKFDIVRKPGIAVAESPDDLTAVQADDGPLALFEIPSALPRARLYTHWRVETNSMAALHEIFNPAFDLQTNVLVGKTLPVDVDLTGSQPVGTAEIVHYAPKDILLNTKALAPSVLLLNDRFTPDWTVWVDGKRDELLCCNYFMRGVYLLPGAHRVEFKFQPPVGLLGVSLAAIATGILALIVFLVFPRKKSKPAQLPITAVPPLNVRAKATKFCGATKGR